MGGNTFVLRLGDGADIIARLTSFVEEKGIDYCLIVGGSGSMRDFEVVSSGPRGSMDLAKSGAPASISALSGKIERGPRGNLSIVANVSLNKGGFKQKGGRIIGGKSAGDLEIHIRKVDLGKIIFG